MLSRNSRPHLKERTERAQKLRNEASVSEKWMWSFLRNNRLGCTFRRQYPVGPFTLDFYCPKHKLCVEVDGEQHFETMERDRERDLALAELGIRVIRVPSLDPFDEKRLAMTSWLQVITEALHD